MKKIVLNPGFKKRLISGLLSTSPNESMDTNFILKGTSEFTSRSDSVFGKLQNLEVAHETWISKNDTIQCVESNKDIDELSNDTKVFDRSTISHVERKRGKYRENKDNDRNDCHNFPFKKPSCPIKYKSRKGPSSGWKNGKKWTKYSLEDVELSSNATNAAVALNFITELRKRKAAKEDELEGSDKIIFAKPTQKKNITRINPKCSSKMKNDEVASKVTNANCVTLHHLEDEE